jgi:hypothetical protein
METNQLDAAVRRIVAPPTRFIGVFAADQVPDLTNLTYFPSCLIANTDPSTKAGQHWVAFWIDSPHSIDFFDSYGLGPQDYGFDIACSSISTKSIQSPNSTVCGQYCLYYLYVRSRGHTLVNFLNSFSLTNTTWNDRQVSRFVNKHFGISNPAETKFTCLQSCRSRASLRSVPYS